MPKVTSRDGTRIDFEQTGSGPALILVGGALEQRAFDSETAKLAALPLMNDNFSVYHYDRRGRGNSGDTQPFAVAREIEDIAALIDRAGGSAFVFGISSGAALAMEATIALPDMVKKLAMYEAPYNADPAARRAWAEYRRSLAEVLAEGRKGDAVGLFMMLVGMPEEHLEGMKAHPLWPLFESVGLTLAYDAAALGDEADVPTDRAAAVRAPTLVMDGGASYPFMHTTALALAEAIPQGQHRTLQGQTHEVQAEALAPVLVEFFNGAKGWQ